MTKREKTLGLVFIGTLVLALGLYLAQIYMEWSQRLDASLLAAERSIAGFELSMRTRSSGETRKKAWTGAEASDESFLRALGLVVREAGWNLRSTSFKGRKEGVSRYSLELEGAGDRWGGLLDAIAKWDRAVLVDSLEAAAVGKGRMSAHVELGYEGP